MASLGSEPGDDLALVILPFSEYSRAVQCVFDWPEIRNTSDKKSVVLLKSRS